MANKKQDPELTGSICRDVLSTMDIDEAETISSIAKTLHKEINSLHSGYVPLGLSLDGVLELIAKIGIKANELGQGAR